MDCPTKYDTVENQKKLANEIGITVVKLQRDEETDNLGFSLTHSNEIGGIFVRDITKGSATERKGIIQPGDRIIWINRKNVEHISIDEAMEILDNAPNGSNMVVTRWQTSNKNKNDSDSQVLKESQLIPNLIDSEEPYMFEVTYLR